MVSDWKMSSPYSVVLWLLISLFSKCGVNEWSLHQRPWRVAKSPELLWKSLRSCFTSVDWVCLCVHILCMYFILLANLLTPDGEQWVSRFYFLPDSILIDRHATPPQSLQGTNGTLTPPALSYLGSRPNNCLCRIRDPVNTNKTQDGLGKLNKQSNLSRCEGQQYGSTATTICRELPHDRLKARLGLRITCKVCRGHFIQHLSRNHFNQSYSPR